MQQNKDSQRLVDMVKQAWEIVEQAIPKCNALMKSTAMSFVLGRMGQYDTIDAMTQFTNRFQNIMDPKQVTDNISAKTPDFVKQALDEIDKKKK